MEFATETAREINALMQTLRDVSKKCKEQTPRLLRRNARPIIDALFAAAPHGTKKHKRYKSLGLNSRIRAPRGKGSVVAKYRPGNLATSFQAFAFKGAKFSLQVGAKFQKGNAYGSFGPGTGQNDAYYTHIVEQRDPFIEPTWNRLRPSVEAGIIKSLKRLIKSANKKNKASE